MGNKVNDTPKNNKPKEQMEWKLLLEKAMTDSTKNANVPSKTEPPVQLLGTLGCEITLLFNVRIHIWANLMCISGIKLAP